MDFSPYGGATLLQWLEFFLMHPSSSHLMNSGKGFLEHQIKTTISGSIFKLVIWNHYYLLLISIVINDSSTNN